MNKLNNRILNFLVKTLNKRGLHLMRSYKIPQSNLNLLELCIPALLYQQQSAFFVQIGASDGKTEDPIFPLVQKYKLVGICVEPLPDIFAELKENYRNSRIIFENVAISDHNGVFKLYKPRSTENTVLVSQKASLKKEVVSGHGFSDEEIEEINVEAITYFELLEKHGILNVDILQIDAEGLDYTILKSIFNRETSPNHNLLPKIIHYESLHLSKNERIGCRELLIRNDYQFIETQKDTLAVKHSALQGH